MEQPRDLLGVLTSEDAQRVDKVQYHHLPLVTGNAEENSPNAREDMAMFARSRIDEQVDGREGVKRE